MTVTFSPLTWVSGSTPASAANMNRIETGVNDCANAINALVPATGGTYTGVVQAKGTGGLLVRYYNLRDAANDGTPNPTDLILTEILNGVNLTNRVPGGVTAFYAVITGYIQPAYNENYTFYVTTDDATKLYIDGFEVIGDAAWKSNSSVTYSGIYSNMKASKWVPVVIVHTNQGGSQRLLLEWQSTSQSRQTIPGSVMKWDELTFEASHVQKAFYADMGVYISGQKCWSRGDLHVQSSAPSSPNTNDVWIDTSVTLT